MWELYTSKAKAQIVTLEEKKAKLENSREYLITQVMGFKEYIETKTKLDYDYLLKQTSKIGFITIANPHLKTYVIYLVDINIQIETLKTYINRLSIKANITYDEFAHIIRTFNRGLGDQILLGYTVSLGHGGLLGVRKKQNANKFKEKVTRIDWGNSNKAKADIIAKGGLPYEAYRDKNFNIIGDNGGEKWLVYHSKEADVWLYWDKSSCVVKNKAFYSFKYGYGGNEGDQAGLIVKLNRLLASNPLAITRFKAYS